MNRCLTFVQSNVRGIMGQHLYPNGTCKLLEQTQCVFITVVVILPICIHVNYLDLVAWSSAGQPTDITNLSLSKTTGSALIPSGLFVLVVSHAQ